ncbi:ATP-binding protein [Geobacter sp. AOG1]|uniref:ATP-binding protein n=1 Tax=Geobacter sp. AOG1 TaxID=1566346 RepID=UPI001CC727D4|nr:ATP-binding protein [Geobacter sp. AOG1]GFE58316.1 two-component sensor histidine kinase [Geobacter sp. AOG1]
MKIGITQRLFLAILAAAFLSVVSMFIIMQWSIDRGFKRYVGSIEQTRLTRLAGQLEERYATQESWDFLKNDPGAWRRILVASIPDEEPGTPDRARRGQNASPPDGKDSRPPLPPHLGRGFAMRVFLLDTGKLPLIGPKDIPANAVTRPLHHQDQIVGYLGLLPRKQLSDEHQVRFLKEQKFALAMVAGMVVLVAAGFSLLLARRLVRPIRALATATDRLAAGEFAARVPVTSGDELGHLARDFNALALTLEKNDQARRQWVADISHELRTPLTVLRGEIEALQDGVRPVNPPAIHSLHGEVLRLGRLVDDLYQLSLSDLGALTYHKEELDLTSLISTALAPYRQEFARKNITLATAVPWEKPAMIFADAERLHQLFTNLLDNALKYTDPGGEVAIRLTCSDGMAKVDMEDSAPGVAKEDLDRLFDRLYRVETSRNRAAGGAGLGLAICRNIVEAHAGSIAARNSARGGIEISVTLPLAEGNR